MLNEKLDVKTRERWTQMHTNTAQVLNQILKDQQFKEWENRLRELESRGYVPKGTVERVGDAEHQEKEDAGSSEYNQGPAGVEGA